jgi:CDP-diacylglycerol--serine O-phosphatidyltransferase
MAKARGYDVRMAYRIGTTTGDRPLPRGEGHRSSRRRRAARRTVSVLPTLFTLANLLAGFLSIFFASRMGHGTGWSPLTYAAAMVFVGMAMDGLDGRIARMTRSTSDLGAQLDSMADMVTFGVAPAFMAVQLVAVNAPFVGDTSADFLFDRFALVAAGIYVACAALRLARFNIEIHKPTESDHGSFKGLPSPGAAGTVASLVLLHQLHLAKHLKAFPDASMTPMYLRVAPVVMVLVMLLVAFAMVSRWRYLHLMNRYLRGRAGITRIRNYVMMLLLAIRPAESLAAFFVLYAFSAPAMSAYQFLSGRRVGNPPETPAADAEPLESSPERRTG